MYKCRHETQNLFLIILYHTWSQDNCGLFLKLSSDLPSACRELTSLVFLFRVSLESRDLLVFMVPVDPPDLLDPLDCPVLPERLVVRYETFTRVLAQSSLGHCKCTYKFTHIQHSLVNNACISAGKYYDDWPSSPLFHRDLLVTMVPLVVTEQLALR